MSNGKQRQALAVSSRLSPQPLLGYSDSSTTSVSAVLALEEEMARIAMTEAQGRLNGQTSGHIVIDSGRLSGFVKDAHTTVRFACGSVAVTTHD
jgi:hypothetical protein